MMLVNLIASAAEIVFLGIILLIFVPPFALIVLFLCPISVGLSIFLYVWFKHLENTNASITPGVIALVLSILGFASLFALIGGIIWCCENKDREENNHAATNTAVVEDADVKKTKKKK